VLNALATWTAGVKLDFKLPFVGMRLRLGSSITRKDIQVVDVTLVPPDLASAVEVRDGDVDQVLVEAIETVTAVVAKAAGGDDPFVLKESTVEFTFAITESGTISFGIEGEDSDTITHTLQIKLSAA
jgi:hypothetical protein